jgi:hypothetical protein
LAAAAEPINRSYLAALQQLQSRAEQLKVSREFKRKSRRCRQRR